MLITLAIQLYFPKEFLSSWLASQPNPPRMRFILNMWITIAKIFYVNNLQANRDRVALFLITIAKKFYVGKVKLIIKCIRVFGFVVDVVVVVCVEFVGAGPVVF